MNLIIAIGAFLKGLLAGLRAQRAAKAGSELVDGQSQVNTIGDDVSALEAEIKAKEPKPH